MPKRKRDTTAGIVYPLRKIHSSALILSRLPENVHLAPQLNPLTTLRRFPSSTSIRNNTLGSGGKRQTQKKRQTRKNKRKKNKIYHSLRIRRNTLG